MGRSAPPPPVLRSKVTKVIDRLSEKAEEKPKTREEEKPWNLAGNSVWSNTRSLSPLEFDTPCTVRAICPVGKRISTGARKSHVVFDRCTSGVCIHHDPSRPGPTAGCATTTTTRCMWLARSRHRWRTVLRSSTNDGLVWKTTPPSCDLVVYVVPKLDCYGRS